MERTDMNKLREIVRIGDSASLSQRAIADATGTSLGTVNHVLTRVRDAGLNWALVEPMDLSTLQALIYPPTPQAAIHMEPDWDTIIEALEGQNRKGRRKAKVTRALLWEEYCAEAKARTLTAYSRSQFFDRLKARRGNRAGGSSEDLAMHFTYTPGELLLSDFSGKTMAIKTRDGERLVEILVAVLPCSNLIFAVAVEDQSLRAWCDAHRQLLSYINGVPVQLICDNLKAAVSKWVDGEPELNKTFQSFARHYEMAVVPTRKAKPRDKAAVENAVKTVQQRILASLRDRSFFSLAMLNEAIAELLDALNHRTMIRVQQSRWQRFAETDGLALRPLPDQHWVYRESVERKVGPNYHVQYEWNLYSVPPQYRGQRVLVLVFDKTVEIWSFDTRQRLVTHQRAFGRNQYRTVPDHMPSSHREREHRTRPGHFDAVCRSLRKIGPDCACWVERVIASHDFPEQALRSLIGAARLSTQHKPEMFQAACRAALATERFGYGFLRDWLKSPPPAAPEAPQEWLPDHDHIRGRAYYRDIGGC